MSDAKGQQEPSMEEILASIRRIIAEDNDTGKPEEEEAVSPPPPPPPPPMRMPEPEPEPAQMAHEDDVLELTEVVEEEEEYQPPEDPFPPRRFEMPDEGLVSKATAAASTAAFAAMHNRARERRGGDVYLGDGAITLEEIVKELLRPQLQEWLDLHLPGLVERLVREEIERLARAAK
jgi:cell pole-organizing protein PopZ